MITEINYFKVHLSVDYDINGTYYPETRFEPAEYPDVIINGIYVGDSNIDIQNMLLETQIDDIISLITND
jgi:hypothetical protein